MSERPGVVVEPERVSDVPSRTDWFVRLISERLGGPPGRRVRGSTDWWNPLRVALLVGTFTYLLGMVMRLNCRVTVAGQAINEWRDLCYTDIVPLYGGRGLLQGNTPFIDSGDYPVLEYPALTGWFLELERLITVAVGAPVGTALTDQQQVDATLTFFDVNTVLLGGLLLVVIWAQVRTVAHRPWDAMMLAASPCVAATALINWDMLPVALTSVGMLLWARRKPGWAGVMLGLGMAAKLYPLFLLGPLLLLCLRAQRMREFGRLLATFACGWLVVNVPTWLLAPDAWLHFWRFNSDRGGEFGSIWYVLSLAGNPVPHLNLVNTVIFVAACAAIGALIIFAPVRPRWGAMAFLVMAAFLMTNKVYSPQYVLWLLPFMILARPRWRDWIIFTTGEMIYFVAIWWHIGGMLVPSEGAPDRVYWAAVVVRLAVEAWIVVLVVRDALHPELDPVRRSGDDDEAGGVLDQAVDAPWLARLPRLTATRHPESLSS